MECCTVIESFIVVTIEVSQYQCMLMQHLNTCSWSSKAIQSKVVGGKKSEYILLHVLEEPFYESKQCSRELLEGSDNFDKYCHLKAWKHATCMIEMVLDAKFKTIMNHTA